MVVIACSPSIDHWHHVAGVQADCIEKNGMEVVEFDAGDDPDGNGIRQTLNLRFPGQYHDAETGLLQLLQIFDMNHDLLSSKSKWRIITSTALFWGIAGFLLVFMLGNSAKGIGFAEGLFAFFTGVLGGLLWGVLMWEFFVKPRLK